MKMSFMSSGCTKAVAALTLALQVCGCTPPGSLPAKMDGPRETVRVMKPEEVKITLGDAPQKPADASPAPSGETVPAADGKASESTTPPATPEQTPAATPPASEDPKSDEKPTTQAEPPAAVGQQLALATDAPAQSGARFKGRVKVEGEFPKLPPLVTAANAKSGCPAVDIPDESVLIGPDGGLKNIVVWLRKVPDGVTPPPPSSAPVVVDQKNCAFTPRIVGVQVGQPIRFTNSDSMLHNVHTNAFKSENPQINTGVPGNDSVGLKIDYAQPEALPVLTICDLHGWMRCSHLVVNHPWFAVTDDKGEFEIGGLPDGDLEFAVWGEKGWVSKSVKLTIKSGETITQEFVVPAANLQKK
jgi:hypothetical protein